MAAKYITVTNLTDVPGPDPKRPMRAEKLDIYNQTIEPGESLNLPPKYVTASLRRLASETTKLAIGNTPDWYKKQKMRPAKVRTDVQAVDLFKARRVKEGQIAEAMKNKKKPVAPATPPGPLKKSKKAEPDTENTAS